MALRFTDIHVGDRIPPLTRRTSTIQLFRFSAATWNAHRIHYEKQYAQSEGYPDILVQAHLHGAFLAQMLNEWIHPHGGIRELEWSNRHYAAVGEVLTCNGVVTDRFERDGEGFVECEIREENDQKEVTAPGRALLAFPLAARQGE